VEFLDVVRAIVGADSIDTLEHQDVCQKRHFITAASRIDEIHQPVTVI
jgi:hypothetical protein